MRWYSNPVLVYQMLGFLKFVVSFFKASNNLTPYYVFHYMSITQMETAVGRMHYPLRAKFQLNELKLNVGKYTCSF